MTTVPATATTSSPTVNGRVIGLAHYAGRAIVESVLTRYGLTFQQLVTLRPAAVADTPVQRDDLVRQVVDGLKIDPAEAGDAVEALITKGLLAPEASLVRVTDSGRALYADTSAETAQISARIYAGIPTEDLAAAGRVLTLVTERANQELAAVSR
ncbi:MarR family winged helix-turn-helix transcriptional regulator [Streptomyces sp. YU58]|uniref:MarR family winged helix-turn-helix transcriptional regulator n=1 Tax=Streptomyces sp. SX92 TaxID=3158972 RepID=UPI0027BB0024|nr:MarR family winged helix-turn-helix transcriptional regulator [Streptomyces coralus]WLW50167.1 MarR family winged helix-turn-helix transcriptional regulator [Streptomyces coralus]